MDLKNNLISLSMGIKEENPMTIMPYKVNKSINDSYERNNNNNLYSLNNEIDVENEEKLNTYSENDNFEDVMKRTQAEYYNTEEENMNDI